MTRQALVRTAAHRRRPAQGAGARRRSCTGCCSRCPTFRRERAPRPRAVISPAPAADFDADEREAMLGAGLRAARRPALRRAVRRRAAAPRCRSSAASTGRAAAARGLRPGRPAGRHRRRGADRRLQDQSSGAAASRARCRTAYVAPARALPRRAGAALSRTRPCAPR